MACSNRSSLMVPASQRLSENGGRREINEIRCGQLAVHAKELTGLPTGFLVVADGVGQDGSVDDDHPLERSSVRSAAA